MRSAILILAATLALVGATAAGASEQDQAREAVEAGAVRPLTEILREVRQRAPGTLLDARLEAGRNGQPVYVLRMLGADGKVRDVIVNAR